MATAPPALVQHFWHACVISVQQQCDQVERSYKCWQALMSIQSRRPDRTVCSDICRCFGFMCCPVFPMGLAMYVNAQCPLRAPVMAASPSLGAPTDDIS